MGDSKYVVLGTTAIYGANIVELMEGNELGEKVRKINVLSIDFELVFLLLPIFV